MRQSRKKSQETTLNPCLEKTYSLETNVSDDGYHVNLSVQCRIDARDEGDTLLLLRMSLNRCGAHLT